MMVKVANEDNLLEHLSVTADDSYIRQSNN